MISLIKKLIRPRRSNKKVSEMLLNITDTFHLGDTADEKQSLLDCAVNAWNIACLDEKERIQAIKCYMKEFKKLNPSFTNKDLMKEKEILTIFINEKVRLYPDEKMQIVNVQVRSIDDKDHVTVTSMQIR